MPTYEYAQEVNQTKDELTGVNDQALEVYEPNYNSSLKSLVSLRSKIDELEETV